MKKRIKTYENGNKENIIQEIVNAATQRLENDEHKDWWRNGTSQYWDFIFKLQCKILEIPWNKNDINEQVTQSFAWGNSFLLQILNLGEDLSNCPNYKNYNN